jgi:hypothetical protein
VGQLADLVRGLSPRHESPVRGVDALEIELGRVVVEEPQASELDPPMS